MINHVFGWIEALNGRLIGPKTWDRIVVIFFKRPFLHSPWVGAVWVNCVLIYVLNCALVCIGPVMAVNPGSLSEPMICEFSGIVTEGFTIPETVF